MAASFNRVILMGNVTRDIELRHTAGDLAVTDIGMAVNDKRKDANGEWVDDVTFVDVTLWGRTAEVAAEYLSKGSPVFIEGRLKLDTWQNNEGQNRSKLKVVAERMQLIGGKPQQQTEFEADDAREQQATAAYSDKAWTDPPPKAGDADLPF